MIKIDKFRMMIFSLIIISFSSFSFLTIHAATVGQPLKSPETGWIRYDDTNAMFTKTGGWFTSSNAQYYNGSYSYTGSGTLTFSFTGSGLRIIGCLYSNRSNDIVVTIDGSNTYHYSAYWTTLIYQGLLFDLQGLSSGTHTVSIKSNQTSEDFEFDAVDIKGPAPSLQIIGISPSSSSIDNALNSNIIATFSNNLKTVGSISLKNHFTNEDVSFSSSISTNQIIIRPLTPLDYYTQYDVSINSFVDVDGGVQSTAFNSSFTTLHDTTKPEVLTIKPPPDSVDVPINQVVEISFSKNIDTNSLSKVYVALNGVNQSITKTVNGSILDLTFNQPLDNNQTYNLHIEGVADTLGNIMNNSIDVKFTTIKAGALTLVSYKPPSGIVPLNQDIELTFSGNVDPSSISYSLVDDNNNTVSSTVKVIGAKVTVVPVLQAGHQYTFSNLKASSIGGDIQSFPLSITLNVMVSTGDSNLDNIVSKNVSMFGDLHDSGLNIILLAIGVGILFVGAIWLWRKLKLWLASSNSNK